MPTGSLRKVLEQLRPLDGSGLSDAQLLGRFLDGGEQAAFAALVRRHGPMVLGVCRRVLGNIHDAEDAFQATFLVLAKKAASVMQREALAGWLYRVAYRAALEAKAKVLQRRARERQVENMPHPEVAPPQAQDWRPVLDRELDALPDKYRVPVVLCDLEGKTRREAARQLGLSEGTLSSQLTRGRRLLARRLTRQGLALSGGALAAALAEGVSAAVPQVLMSSTVEAAVLIAAGQAAAVATPAAALMRGVLKAMLLAKLKLVVAFVVVIAALGASGIAYRSAAGPSAAQAAPPDGQPLSEVEALRRKVELLQVNLDVVLEKVRAQEAELRKLREQVKLAEVTIEHRSAAAHRTEKLLHDVLVAPKETRVEFEVNVQAVKRAEPDAVKEVEDALKALRTAPGDVKARQKAVAALERALAKLHEQRKPADTNTPLKDE
jgi:RNA polymerase sigma factor (sigma-70 family)